MKFIHHFTGVLCLLLATPAFCRDFRPDGHMENVPLPNDSVQQCYIFKTTAGVGYTVEVSNDLIHWTTQDEIYGLGNEYAVTMREFTAPPPPPPGTPPAEEPDPAKNASVSFQHASGGAGGTVVSWKSLDHGGPVSTRISGEIVAGWDQMPLFCERYDAYCFFILCSGATTSPPAVNPILGPNDSAMLAVLEASLSAMNQEVTDNVARSRNAPAPAPPDPDGKRFWRVHIDPTIDTDSDGSPDWSEFEIAARIVAGSPPADAGVLDAGVTPNAFNGDTNGDGKPDGLSLDGDRDRTADANDQDSSDNTVTMPLGPLPRYALFPITNATPDEPFPFAYQISDKGTVLYNNGTWCGGKWTDLKAPPGDDPHFFGRAINDHDVILGWGNMKIVEDPERYADVICSWSAPDAVPDFVTTTSGGASLYAGPSYEFVYAGLSPGPVLSDDGHFLMPTNGLKDDNPYVYLHKGLWKLAAGGSPVSEEESGSGLSWNQGVDHQWGYDYDDTDGYREFGVVSGAPDLSFVPKNVITLPDGGLTIAMPGWSDGIADAVVLKDGNWIPSDTYAPAVDMAADGTAIGRNSDKLTAPILLNGKWTDIKRTTPMGIAVNYPPSGWNNSPITLLDTTPGGWILAQRDKSTGGQDYAAMLPIRVEGKYETSVYNEAGQEIPKTYTQGVGVDDFSIGSTNPGAAVNDQIWIMAPAGIGATMVTFKAPLNSTNPATLKSVGNNLIFGSSRQVTLDSPATSFAVSTDWVPSDSMGVAVDLYLGDLISESRPLNTMLMKRRTVKVNVYKIAQKHASGNSTPTDPQMVPGEAELTRHLDNLFLPQINVKFDVKFAPDEVAVEWDTNNDAIMNSGVDSHSNDQGAIIAAVQADATDAALPPADISLYLVSSPTEKLGDDRDAVGITNRAGSTCWVLGNRSPDYRTKQQVLQTIGHEIGHVFFGYGHPSEYSGGEKGPAALPGTHHSSRLMCKGTATTEDSRIIVKGEWDEGYQWLRARPNGDN